MKLSFIIPTLNEESYIRSCLEPLQQYREKGHEIILADGGSTDETLEIAEPLVDRITLSGKGRARQLNAGAAAATGDIFFFVHADTLLTSEINHLLSEKIHSTRAWGRFDVRLSGSHPLLRVIELLMNLRSRITGIATGDQVIFVTRTMFRECGGFPDVPIMEDIEMSTRLLRICRPECLHEKVVTSSRRWEHNGIVRTIVKMWYLRLIYHLGADPEVLARKYG